MKELTITQLDQADVDLYNKAVAMRANAYIPYSHFAVGAALRCADGSIFAGCNVENASYGLCCCAERNAIFAAVCSGQRELDTLCVVADTSGPVSPCGACRQVMSEFKIKRVLLANLNGAVMECTVEELLPYGFTL